MRRHLIGKLEVAARVTGGNERGAADAETNPGQRLACVIEYRADKLRRCPTRRTPTRNIAQCAVALRGALMLVGGVGDHG